MNERTHFFIKIYISHTLLSKGFMFLWYVRDGWRQGQTTIHDLTSSLDHSALCYFKEPTSHFFCILAGVAQPGVAEGHSPQSASWPSLWPFCFLLTQQSPAPAYILS